MKKRSVKTFIALAASVVMLAGCGSTPTDTGEPAQTSETETRDPAVEEKEEKHEA